MGRFSQIEWCHHTFNTVWGCTKVAHECEFCYAEDWAARFGFGWGLGSPRRTFGPKHWAEPLNWDRVAAEAGERHRGFSSSMADVFEDHPTVTGELPKLRDLIQATYNLDWLLLTKRPENVLRLWPNPIPGATYLDRLGPGMYPQIWLGTTVGHRKSLWRIDALRKLHAKVRFLSIEPLLEDLGPIDLTGIGWVIVGGESGPNARPMHPAWARSIRDQCVAAGVPFFFKQWGEWKPGRSEWSPGEPMQAARWIEPDGSFSEWGKPQAGTPWHVCRRAGLIDLGKSAPHDAVFMTKVGKKAAGRLLDGRTWDELPEPAGVGHA